MDELLYPLLNDCTVSITIGARSRGTGFFLLPGYVLTAAHVLGDASSARVRWKDLEWEARVENRQDDVDLALLGLDGNAPNHPCVYLHESIRPGDMLYGFAFTEVSKGGEGSRFECEGLRIGPTLIKFKAGQVMIGASGAPLLNERTGGVCGMVKASRDAHNSLGGLAVPTSVILSVFPSLKELTAEYHRRYPRWRQLMQIETAQGEVSVKLGDVAMPSAYRKLIEPVETFLSDRDNRCNDYNRNVFIMTRFQKGNKTLVAIDAAIRNALTRSKLRGHRADDRCYPTDRNLWDNVCTYMFGCKFGIAVLEDILQDEFNPNVALEFGFMRALGKPVLLLKEKRMKPRADILGILWEEFDILDIESTVMNAVDRWITDCRIDLTADLGATDDDL